uniref:Variant surface glycoprotein 1125.2060 n=1 Tax=Trypanosoma brucei TaxID=5691 RepID=A0A1J0R7V2_9TRYP|nr:variant surface glycoprotein 1125.2060 [Trypanosoma brucei]
MHKANLAIVSSTIGSHAHGTYPGTGTIASHLNCHVTTTLKETSTITCDKTSGNTLKAANIRGKLASAKKLKVGHGKHKHIAQLKIYMAGKGNLGTGNDGKAGASAAHCEQTSNSNIIKFTKLENTASFSATDIDLTAAGEVQQSEESTGTPGQIQLLTTDSTLRQAILQVRSEHKTLPSKLATETFQSLAGSKTAKRLQAWLTEPPGGRIKLESNTDKIAEAIFGKKEGNIQNEFLDPLTKDSHTIPTDGDAITGSTQKLAEDNFEQAMAYYTAQKLKKVAEAEVKPKANGQTDSADKLGEKKGVDDKTGAECTATEEGKCDKNKCTWDKEKNQCKVKEGAVISAVIKVLLVLAVLLF